MLSDVISRKVGRDHMNDARIASNRACFDAQSGRRILTTAIAAARHIPAYLGVSARLPYRRAHSLNTRSA
jgi:hypothetical protein